MSASYNSQQRERLESLLKVHLRKEEGTLSVQQKIDALEKKNRKKWWFLVINVAAILFFGYSFFSGITQLGSMFFYIIVGVFVINIGLIFYQRKQLNKLVEYLKWKKNQ